MAVFLRTAYGTSYPDARGLFERCPISEDERLFYSSCGSVSDLGGPLPLHLSAPS